MDPRSLIQGSDDWLRARCGSVGASRVADVMATTRSGPSASRKNYLAEIVTERLTGLPAERFISAAMTHGTDTEPQARMAYEFMCDAEVEQVGLIPHPAIPGAHASPDGLIGDEGMIEIKCPNTATHIETLLTGKIEGKYLKQMQFQLACSGRAWCDFVSFDPRLPAEMQLFIHRVQRDPVMITEIEAAVTEFLAEVDETVAALRARYMQEAAA